MRIIQRGFTLIEMMIVIAIIGVLAALAVPMMTDFITRAQVAEAISLVNGIRSPLAEYAQTRGDWPTQLVAPGEDTDTSDLAVTLQGNYGRFDMGVYGPYPTGTLIYDFSKGKASGSNIEFSTTDGGQSWSCTGGTLEARYRPAACRNTP